MGWKIWMNEAGTITFGLADDATWAKAEATLEKILKKDKVKYETAAGEAAFYGPKMDLIVKDAIGREWQLSTVQLDFSMPQRFGLEYIDAEGKKKTPVMIHRAIIGSPERFLAILLEHYGGALPVWLSPVQVAIIPVSSDFVKIGQKLAEEFEAENIRVEVDQANETVGNKIRQAEKQKVPYMLVMGEKEAKSKQLNVRIRGQKEVQAIDRKKFIEQVKEENGQRK